MRASWIAVAMLASSIVGNAAPVFADDTGVAGALHSYRRVGSKTCLDGHFHDGSGMGASQKVAMADAIKNWSGFTAFEYGSDWSGYGNAVSKSATCDRGSSSFTCQVSAIPCKGGSKRR
jgi:hypothetical protein